MLLLISIALAHPGADIRVDATANWLLESPCEVERALAATHARITVGALDHAEQALAHARSCAGPAHELDRAQARLHLARGEVEQAYQLTRGAIERAPDDLRLHALHAEAAEAADRPEEALRARLRTLQRAHPSPESLQQVLQTLGGAERWKEAWALLERQPVAASPGWLRRTAVQLALASEQPTRGLAWVQGEDPEWRLLRAELLDALDRTEEACATAASAAPDSLRPGPRRDVLAAGRTTFF